MTIVTESILSMCAKRLFLIRHAKSSWNDPDLYDFERPLNKRGKHDAPYMGKLLHKKNILPDLIISSHAERAMQTASIIAKELGYPEERIAIEKKLYEAVNKDILDVLQRTDENVEVLFLFGHNPGLTTLHNFICKHFIDNIPTCGITEYEFGDKWENLSGNTCRLISFEYPKKYFK